MGNVKVQEITLVAVDGDRTACDLLMAFAKETGSSMISERQHRELAEQPVTLAKRQEGILQEWSGVLHFPVRKALDLPAVGPCKRKRSEKRRLQQLRQQNPERFDSVACTARIVAPHSAACQSADWIVVSGNAGKQMSSSPKRTSRFATETSRLTVISPLPVNYGQNSEKKKAFLRMAANNLAKDIGGQHNNFRPHVISYHGGEASPDFQAINDWTKRNLKFSLTTGLCLHATENKHGIVRALDQGALDLLGRTMKCALEPMIHLVSAWELWTFGPRDYDFLWENGMQEILLPYMIGAPKEVVCADLKRNLELSQLVAATLRRALGIPVTLKEIHEVIGGDFEKILAVAKERAKSALPLLLKNPPDIFMLLETDEEKEARTLQEFMLYLAETMLLGRKPGNLTSPRVASIGLEVHGGYTVLGRLNHGPDGEFLPVAMAHPAARQHYGAWTAESPGRASSRECLSRQLAYLGF